jgi:HEAT repeat protein
MAPLLAAARGLGDAWLPDPLLVRALAVHGAAGVPALLDGLRDPDPGVRWHAAAALMHVGRAPSAVPGVLAAMNDGVWVVRNAAGRALEDVSAPESLTVLAEAAADPSVETRYHAVRAIARQGAAAARVLPTLRAALRDSDWEVRSDAARALGGAALAAGDAAPALAEATRDADPQVRISALWALWQVGGGSAARAAAQAALQDAEREVRDAALDLLARMERER